jgi:hypothetical protein
LSDYKENEFDPSEFPATLRLARVVPEPVRHIVYRTVCGAQIEGYDEAVIEVVLHWLRKIQTDSISRGLTLESSHLEHIICACNEQHQHRVHLRRHARNELEEKLNQLYFERESIESKHEQQIAATVAERDLTLQRSTMQHEERLQFLERECNTPKVLNRYAKHSNPLITMKRNADVHPKAKAFDAAAHFSQKGAEHERRETEEAIKQMTLQHEMDKEQIMRTFGKRLSDLEAEKRRVMSIVSRQIEMTERSLLELQTTPTMKPPSSPSSWTTTELPPLLKNKKLQSTPPPRIKK